jgi:hypothetical protein
LVEVFTFCESLTVDLGLMSGGENALGLFALSSQSTQGASISLDIKTCLLLESSYAPVDEDVVEVLTTEMGVAIGGLDLEDTILNGEEGHIESATSKIEDEYILLTLASLIKTVCDGSGSRLVDDALHVKTSNCSGVLSGLALRVIKVGWDCDDCRVDRLSEVSLCDFLHLHENHG